MKLAVVIPAHNESRTIARVLDELLGFEIAGSCVEIIVVDDGSGDDTVAIVKGKGVVVVSHLLNRGLGGALGTGITAALLRGADLIVTFDADGQHAPEDIPRVIAPIVEGKVDAVIGSRMLGGKGMPMARRVANRLANLVTLILFGIRTTDSQSGLRAFSRFAAQQLHITANNYDVSSQICGEIRRLRFRFAEVPICSIYTEYSMSKGQGFVTGLKTLFRLLITITGR